MKRNTNKKGFTIVELVIVIAVIAILAAVLIPTFSNLISKANLSSDMQAVRQMNLALTSDEAVNGKPANLLAATINMSKQGYEFENYKPVSSTHRFFWDSVNNKIVLAEKDGGKIIFPNEYEGKFLDETYKPLYRENLISAEKVENFKEEVLEVAANKQVNVSTPEQLLALAAIVNGATDDAETLDGYTITLTEKEYDLSAIGNVWIPIGETNTTPFKGTLKGHAEGTVIKGLTSNGYTTDVANAVQLSSGQIGVAYGLISFAENATIENITIDGANVDLGDTGVESGLLVGTSNGNLTIKNCHVINSTITGQSKIGGLVGVIDNEINKADDLTILIEDCTVMDTTVKAASTKSNIRAGAIVGAYTSLNKNYVAVIKDCKTNATVISNGCAGGIMGHQYAGGRLRVENCETTATLTAPQKGYILGWYADANYIEIVETKANGALITEPSNALFGYYPFGETRTVVITANSVTSVYTAKTTDNITSTFTKVEG